MATVSELFRQIQKAIDDSADNIDMVDWMNRCQDNVADLLYLPTLKTISRDATANLYPVPIDCNGELKILVPNGISTYSIYDNYLYFEGHDSSTLDTIQITYNRIPVAVTNNPDQVPDIPKQFHDIYVFYSGMMYCEQEEEAERYAMFEKEYIRMRGQLQKYMGKMRPKPESWKVVR